MSDNSIEKAFQACLTRSIVWAAVFGISFGIFIGGAVIWWLHPLLEGKFYYPIKTQPDNLIIGVLVLGIFLFTLCRFFNTKLPGYGPFNASTLLITLALMVALASFLVDGVTGDDITKIVFAVIGFAGGLFASKIEKKPEETPKPKRKRKAKKPAG